MRRGIGFRGRALDPRQMPVGELRNLTDLEARAIYNYVRSIGAK
jgi:hypothetical protein